MLRLASLFAPVRSSGLLTVGRSLLRAFGARSGLENLLTVAAPKIQLPFVPGPVCVAGKPLSHVRVIVSYSSAVLRIVLPMRDVGTTVDIDPTSAPVDVSTPKPSTRRPAPERVARTKGNSRPNDPREVSFRIVIVRGIVGIRPFAIDDCGIVVRHVKGVGIGRLDGDHLS